MPQPPPELPPEAQAEFLRLFSQHSRRIYQFILTLTMNHVDAEEVYQNTCVVLWRKCDKFDPDGYFYAWAAQKTYERAASALFIFEKQEDGRWLILAHQANSQGIPPNKITDPMPDLRGLFYETEGKGRDPEADARNQDKF